jgi:hypothetical protein
MRTAVDFPEPQGHTVSPEGGCSADEVREKQKAGYTMTNREEIRVAIAPDPEFMGHLIEKALQEALLCARCTQLIDERTTARQPIAQEEICATCQSVINQFISAEVERRVHEEMKVRGVPLDAIQIGDRH